MDDAGQGPAAPAGATRGRTRRVDPVSVQVRFLGSADAFNTRGQCHACHLVESEHGKTLLDCGPTALLALKRENLTAGEIDTILLSHLHGDHFGGVPFVLLASIYDSPRTRPLRIVGPPGTEQRVAELYRALYRDISQRPLPFEVEYIETTGDETLELDSLSVRAFPVPHQEYETSLGLRVETGGKAVLYSGDTGWTETLVEQSRDTDLFICECCFYDTRVHFHLDYPRIAENRHRFGCRRLVLTHVGREVAEHRDEIDDDISRDGMIVEL